MNPFKRPYFITLLLLLPFCRATGQSTFDFNAQCEQAYQRITELKVKEGEQLLDAEKKVHPNNLIPYFLENYIHLFRVLFDGGTTEYKAYLQASQKRLSKIKKGPAKSTYYLFTRSMINLQTGACKCKNGEYVSGLWSLRKAYLQVLENEQKFPGFAPNKLILGTMKAFIGSIPSGYRWATRLIGFKNGSISEGIRILHSYIQDNSPNGSLFQSEAYFYYIYMIFYLKHDPDKALQVIQEQHLDIVNNALYAFMAANLNLNDNNAAAGEKILSQRNKGPEYLNMPILHYELGTMKLYHLDLNAAIQEFQQFLKHYKGKIYVKDALYKLSWAYYLKGNKTQAAKYRKEVLAKGNEVTDADKVAVREVQSNDWPDATILKARLLFTGGYLNDALKTIQTKRIEDYKTLPKKIKYTYFLSRINDKLGRKDEALKLYDATIKSGHNRPEYYAARAALQTAFIYEKRKNTTKALNYFKKCLNMPNEEYKQSLDQRAKSGISRLTQP